jgi:tRNA(Ile)-lysidine synthase
VPNAAPIEDGELDGLLASLRPFSTLILAVSGGADSMAMLHLVARWSQLNPARGRRILVATVDHGLREGSRAEALRVAQAAQAIGLEHALLSWEGAKPATGVQDAARVARYRLLGELAWRIGEAKQTAIVTAHTEDDQAETLLMRLARGSGLDGLTGMSASRLVEPAAACTLVRPLLATPGARLKATLQAKGIAWIEDPSNECDRFERVRLRKARAGLEAIGLSSDKVALSAKRLARARAALEAATSELAVQARLDVHGGIYASLDAHVFSRAPEELRLRLLSKLLVAFGGQDEPVRLAKLEALIGRLSVADFEAATLAGCIVARHGADIRVMREPGRTPLPEVVLPPGSRAVWDRRFGVAAAPELGASVAVRALGPSQFAALRRALESAAASLVPWPPALAAAALPAFWHLDGTLLTVPQLRGLPGAPADWSSGDGELCSAEFLW